MGMAEHMTPDTGQMTSTAVYWSHEPTAQGRRILHMTQSHKKVHSGAVWTSRGCGRQAL